MTDQLERIPLDVIEHVFFSKSPSKKELMPEITGEENDFTVIKVSDPPKKASPKKEFYDRIPSEMIRHKIPSVFYDKKKLPEVDIFEGRRFYSHPKSLLRLHVKVIKAKGFPQMNIVDGTNPFCIVKVAEREQRTSIIRNSLTPKWEQEFHFDVRNAPLQDLEIVLCSSEKEQDIEISNFILPLRYIPRDTLSDQWVDLIPIRSIQHAGSVHLLLHFATPDKTPFVAYQYETFPVTRPHPRKINPNYLTHFTKQLYGKSLFEQDLIILKKKKNIHLYVEEPRELQLEEPQGYRHVPQTRASKLKAECAKRQIEKRDAYIQLETMINNHGFSYARIRLYGSTEKNKNYSLNDCYIE